MADYTRERWTQGLPGVGSDFSSNSCQPLQSRWRRWLSCWPRAERAPGRCRAVIDRWGAAHRCEHGFRHGGIHVAHDEHGPLMWQRGATYGRSTWRGAVVTAVRLWLVAPLRYKWYAIDNWVHGYRFWILRSHRCCGHTVPSHYAWCDNGSSTQEMGP